MPADTCWRRGPACGPLRLLGCTACRQPRWCPWKEKAAVGVFVHSKPRVGDTWLQTPAALCTSDKNGSPRGGPQPEQSINTPVSCNTLPATGAGTPEVAGKCGWVDPVPGRQQARKHLVRTDAESQEVTLLHLSLPRNLLGFLQLQRELISGQSQCVRQRNGGLNSLETLQVMKTGFL